MKKYLLFLFLLSACSKDFDITAKNGGNTGGGGINPPGGTTSSSKQVNGSLPLGAGISASYEVTPDQTKIVYLSEEDGSGCKNIYVYTISSGARAKITNICSAGVGRSVKVFKISPNSQKIVFLADYNSSGHDDLFSANLTDGSLRTQLNVGVSGDEEVLTNFKISADSTKVVFITDEVSGYSNLFSNQIVGADIKKLNYNIEGPVIDFDLANTTVVYKISNEAIIADNIRNSSQFAVNPNLRKVEITASGDMQINQAYPIPSPQERGVVDFRISPDKSRVIFWGNVEGGTARELYTSSLSGVAQVRITNIATGTSPNGGIRSAGFNKAGTRAIYVADSVTAGVFEIFQVAFNGLNNLKLNSTLLTNGSEEVLDFQVSPDGSKIIYKKATYSGGDSQVDAYSVDSTTFSVSKINSTIGMKRNVGEYVFLPNGIGYLMNKNSQTIYSAYTNSQYDALGETMVSSVPADYEDTNSNTQLSSLGSLLVYTGKDPNIGLYVGSTKVNSGSNVVITPSSKSFIVLGNNALPNYGKIVYLESNGSTTNLIITTVQ